MTASELVAALVANLATVYPARTANLGSHPGRVTCVVEPSSGEYMSVSCDPVPVEIEVNVRILAAGSNEQSVVDLLTHIDPVASLIRGAGFAPTVWRSEAVGDLPGIVMSAVTDGKG